MHHVCFCVCVCVRVSLKGQAIVLSVLPGCYGESLHLGYQPEQACLLDRGWVLAFCHARSDGREGHDYLPYGASEDLCLEQDCLPYWESEDLCIK